MTIVEILLPVKIDSKNCFEVEQDIFSQISKAEDFSHLYLNADQLEYISSVGLRMLLKLSKQYKEIHLINVGPVPYEVFDITGFTGFMDIRRRIRSVSVSGCPVIGVGSNSVVYKLDEEKVLKLYNSGTMPELVQKESDAAHNAFILGFPTAIPYEIVKEESTGIHGIVFELVVQGSLSDAIKADYTNFAVYAEKFANLVTTINRIEDENDKFPRITTLYHVFLDELPINAEYKKKLHDFLNLIPERNTMIHGDLHPKNIVIYEDEFLTIDMPQISHGHPLFELLSVYHNLIYCPQLDLHIAERFFGCNKEDSKKLWDEVLKHCLGTEDPEKLERMNFLLEKLLPLHCATLLPRHLNQPEELRARVLKHVVEDFIPYIGDYRCLIEEADRLL